MDSTYDWVKLCETSEYTFNVAYTTAELNLQVRSKGFHKTLKKKITNQTMSEQLKDIFMHIENLYNYIQSQNNYKVQLQQNKIMVIVKIQMPFSNTKEKSLPIHLEQEKELVKMVNRYSEGSSEFQDLRAQIRQLRKEFESFKNKKPSSSDEVITGRALKEKINEEREFIIGQVQKFVGANMQQVALEIEKEVKKLQKKDDELIKLLNTKVQSNSDAKVLAVQRKCNQIAEQAKRIERKIDTQTKALKESLNEAIKDFGKTTTKKAKTNIFGFDDSDDQVGLTFQRTKNQSKSTLSSAFSNNSLFHNPVSAYSAILSSVTKTSEAQTSNFRSFCARNPHTHLTYDRSKPFMGRYKIENNLIIYNNKTYDEFCYFLFSNK